MFLNSVTANETPEFHRREYGNSYLRRDPLVGESHHDDDRRHEPAARVERIA
jgi:hypothetical protein